MLKVRDIMSSDVVTVSPELSLRDAMELLASQHVSGAPVVRQGKVVGVVSAMDLIRVASTVPGVPTVREEQVELDTAIEPTRAEEVEAGNEPSGAYFYELWDDSGAEVSEHVAAPAGPEWSALDEHFVSEAMTFGIVKVPPDASAASVAELMRNRRIHRVLVIQDDKLLGIVSALDVARAAAAGRFTSRTYVFNRDRDFGDRAEQ
jgi:CBS domain-containing protein